MKRHILILLLMMPMAAHASQPDLRQVFLTFEAAYLSNDAASMKSWLSPDVKLSETLHIPGGEASTVRASRSQLLKSMRRNPKASNLPRSKLDDVHVVRKPDGHFCGTAATKETVTVSEKRYEEREVRRVCFEPAAEGYKVTRQEINVFYEAE